MSWPNRQKSVKNLLAYDLPNRGLEFQQLKTQPQSQRFKISVQKIIHNSDMRQKGQIQDLQSLQRIQSMCRKCYNSAFIFLENQIQLKRQGECLKRYYYEWQHRGKIQNLTQYYKFHEELPRIFIAETHEIVTLYQQERRNLEYQRVKNKIEEDKLLLQKNQNHNIIENQSYKHKIESKKTAPITDNKKYKKSQKMLKNIHLSYIDFENKPAKKPIRQKSKSVKSKNLQNKQKHAKNNSLSYRSLLTKDIHITNRQKSNSTKNIFPHKKYSLKNVESQQLKNLQSKYSQVISELFRNKRKISKKNNSPNDQKQPSKECQDKPKQETIEKIKNELVSCNINQDKQQPCKQGGAQDEKKGETKNITRSKSHSNILTCKSNKLLQTLNTKNTEKAQQGRNMEQISKKMYKQTQQSSKKKQTSNTKPQLNKWSSNKSLTTKNQQTGRNANKNANKNVKVFQLTKKQLRMAQKDHVPCHNYESNHVDKANKQKISHSQQPSIGKQNIQGQRIRSKRFSSSKAVSIFQLKSTNPHKRQDHTKARKTTSTNMFDRVLKGKIRG